MKCECGSERFVREEVTANTQYGEINAEGKFVITEQDVRPTVDYSDPSCAGCGKEFSVIVEVDGEP